MSVAGQVFSKRYELERQIGRGGMADVWLARDELLGRRVAVKILHSEFARDPSFVERFRREAQSAANLNHPNIVAVYDWGEEGDTYFIVMEYVEGQSLRDVLRTYERLVPTEAARIAADMADALSVAHRSGVVHRDVKPANVLITPRGEVKVTDFGIARAEASGELTRTGSVMGTATYFSPEQAQGQVLDGRSDVYALGVVLYEMVTGRPPFVADNPVSVAYKHVREEPPLPSAVTPGTPGALDRIVRTAMAKDVALRYQSAQDLRADLLRFERGRPLIGGPMPLPAHGHAHHDVAAATTATPRVATATPQAPRRRAGPIVATSLALGLLVTLIVVLIVTANLGGGDQVDTVDVPGVTGVSFADAETTLTGVGFKVVREDVESTEAADVVLAQRPEAGRLATKGGRIRLQVSSATIKVPNVVGRTREAAQAELTKVGLQPQFVEQEVSNQAPGTVLAQDPKDGTDVPKSAPTVKVTVAKEAPVAVPDVKDRDPAAAGAALGAAGFTVTQAPTPSSTVEAGKVIGTDPAAGTMLPKGSSVKLLVSTGPEKVAVPNVVGQQLSAAVATLQAAGFEVTIVSPVNPPIGTKPVISQSPAGGQADKGSKVTITVGP